MKAATKAWMKKQLTISKILMAIGAIWIIIYGILVAAKVIDNRIYGWNASWQVLILIGVFWILVPFSTMPGWWSRIWAILLTALSLIIVIGFFVGEGVDYKSVWTYLNPLPHIVMAVGSIFWILQG